VVTSVRKSFYPLFYTCTEYTSLRVTHSLAHSPQPYRLSRGCENVGSKMGVSMVS
jgi:hypothetical protein